MLIQNVSGRRPPVYLELLIAYKSKLWKRPLNLCFKYPTRETHAILICDRLLSASFLLSSARGVSSPSRVYLFRSIPKILIISLFVYWINVDRSHRLLRFDVSLSVHIWSKILLISKRNFFMIVVINSEHHVLLIAVRLHSSGILVITRNYNKFVDAIERINRKKRPLNNGDSLYEMNLFSQRTRFSLSELENGW